MPATYEPIATTTLSSNQTSVTFSSISGSYTDIVIIAATKNDANNNMRSLSIRFNSDSGTNYSATEIVGDGSSAASYRSTSATNIGVALAPKTSSGDYATNIIHLMNYANTTTNKTILVRVGTPSESGYVAGRVGLWRSTSAITSLTMTINADNIASGSTFTLYGIKAA